MPNGANPYADAARLRKALALTDKLDAFGIDSRAAADLSVAARLDLATAAGARVPSSETWELVVGMLRAREESRVLATTVDPFMGLS